MRVNLTIMFSIAFVILIYYIETIGYYEDYLNDCILFVDGKFCA